MHDLFYYTSITADSMQFPLLALTTSWQFDSKTYITMLQCSLSMYIILDSGACSDDKAFQ